VIYHNCSRLTIPVREFGVLCLRLEKRTQSKTGTRGLLHCENYFIGANALPPANGVRWRLRPSYSRDVRIRRLS